MVQGGLNDWYEDLMTYIGNRLYGALLILRGEARNFAMGTCIYPLRLPEIPWLGIDSQLHVDVWHHDNVLE